MRRQNFLVAMILFGTLAGCQPEADPHVVAFVKRTKNEHCPYTPENTESLGVASCLYSSGDLRDPFQSSFMPNHEGGASELLQPHRPKETLETYLLDSLSMIGTLERGGTYSVLLKDTLGSIHRATVGNYLGKNAGKIEKITESEMVVAEWVLDEKDALCERTIIIPLTILQKPGKGE